MASLFITFCVTHSRDEMYIGYDHLSVCLSVRPSLHSHTTARTGGMLGCPLVVHYWADLQSVHKVCCYDSIVQNAKCLHVI